LLPQLRTGGVIEALRMCRARFASRMPFADVCTQYRFILPVGAFKLPSDSLASIIAGIAEVLADNCKS
jgi:myosin heavy subunit